MCRSTALPKSPGGAGLRGCPPSADRRPIVSLVRRLAMFGEGVGLPEPEPTCAGPLRRTESPVTLAASLVSAAPGDIGERFGEATAGAGARPDSAAPHHGHPDRPDHGASRVPDGRVVDRGASHRHRGPIPCEPTSSGASRSAHSPSSTTLTIVAPVEAREPLKKIEPRRTVPYRVGRTFTPNTDVLSVSGLCGLDDRRGTWPDDAPPEARRRLHAGGAPGGHQCPLLRGPRDARERVGHLRDRSLQAQPLRLQRLRPRPVEARPALLEPCPWRGHRGGDPARVLPDARRPPLVRVHDPPRHQPLLRLGYPLGGQGRGPRQRDRLPRGHPPRARRAVPPSRPRRPARRGHSGGPRHPVDRRSGRPAPRRAPVRGSLDAARGGRGISRRPRGGPGRILAVRPANGGSRSRGPARAEATDAPRPLATRRRSARQRWTTAPEDRPTGDPRARPPGGRTRRGRASRCRSATAGASRRP